MWGLHVLQTAVIDLKPRAHPGGDGGGRRRGETEGRRGRDGETEMERGRCSVGERKEFRQNEDE